MAAAGKKTIVVDTRINPYGETKTKKAPGWFVARPGAAKAVSEIGVKRAMQLDPRKWKKKVIEDGVYAVARYELALFATTLSDIEKQIVKALPKDQKKKKFTRNAKSEGKEEKAALDAAEAEVKKVFKKLSKAIQDKVSLALDEVESDKGDNKQALAAGKAALKKFDEINKNDMFSTPTDQVKKLLEKLAVRLEKAKGDDPAAIKAAESELAASRKKFEATTKKVDNIVKYLLHKGEKMSKDKKSDQALQEVGKLIISPKVKPDLMKVSMNVDDFEKQLDEVGQAIGKKDNKPGDFKALAKTFDKKNAGKDADLRDAVKSMIKVKTVFNKAVKDVKK